ncbi:PREDICTED: transmembrane protein 68-like [Thamnophis sirtalis]|uniref:Transmembrane protein 68-like n=1 Tax=Thamnophis sirtalis TaxID=35019 RepID=A0A6I9X4T0_9SAUR|nr:PREDICTED: transmembrane protein 68-like [Thamnophis sirtalis]
MYGGSNYGDQRGMASLGCCRFCDPSRHTTTSSIEPGRTGYEVIGMENLPQGPGLIVYYHGAVVFDYIMLIAKVYAKTGRTIQSVVHCFFYLIPGIKLCLDIVGCIEGKQTFCADVLNRGYLLGIAPGGLREQNFSNENYNLEWSTRTGFAKVALKNKVCSVIYGTFCYYGTFIVFHCFNATDSSCLTIHHFITVQSCDSHGLSKWLYEHFRFLCLPIYGGFPVKLRTYIGEPIPYDPNLTAKELAEKTKIAIENLRDRHQKLPGNILRALLERFDKNKKDA